MLRQKFRISYNTKNEGSIILIINLGVYEENFGGTLELRTYYG